ncbi:hypothetical protein CXG81DRAFT_9573 [Caulochytrium protostelioides]|uniref:Bola-like protein n=1 Tax=Caulochytrium protostelioides TaxID=1555241 RepID=A0A4P9XD39_9FUNG|nr:hypothetical protein CXG81DRAFT_9573 [Caulochytrium protostelioides]|eukprot:RKP03397.1 hypothetical protein CXG81DRAFT_9573 [Caulochytrium protostelioides]
MGPVASALREKLAVAFDPLVLDIIDDSSKHAGHAAMKGLKPVETHFRVTIVAEAFKDRKLVQRHRMVYDAVDAELKAGVHALSITARTPDEAAAKQAAADAAAAS